MVLKSVKIWKSSCVQPAKAQMNEAYGQSVPKINTKPVLIEGIKLINTKKCIWARLNYL